MKKIAISIAAAAFIALSFFAGYEANTNVKVETKTVTKNVDNPVEHCVTSVLKKFDENQGEQIPECSSLTEAQQKQAFAIVSGFMDSAVDEFGQ